MLLLCPRTYQLHSRCSQTKQHYLSHPEMIVIIKSDIIVHRFDELFLRFENFEVIFWVVVSDMHVVFSELVIHYKNV